MLTATILVLIGTGLLYFGAEALVTGAASIALRFGVSALVVGLTVVSFCTSMPEGIASLTAQLRGDHGDVALGNIIGSNISNIALILGCTALVRPIRIFPKVVSREMPIMVVVSTLLLVVMSFGEIGLASGLVLIALLFAYIAYQFVHDEKSEAYSGLGGKDDLEIFRIMRTSSTGLACLLGGGILTLVLGGYLLVEGAMQIAQSVGMSDRVIGLTVVAIGTSLPELATSMVASLRGNDDISLGNVIGSNIFNILCILGGIACIAPIQFSSQMMSFDVIVMLAISLGLWLLMWKQQCLGRVRGGILLSVYVSYVWYLVCCS